MPQIDTPDNFDFSKDQHKLLLVEDLKRLAKLIGNLEEVNRIVETEPSAQQVFPSNLTAGEVSFGTAVGGAIRAPVSFLSSESAGLGGRIYVSGTGVAAAGTNAMSSYTLTGESLSRWAPYFNFSHSTSSQQYNLYVVGRLPDGFRAWKPTGIELDFRAIWTTVATDVCVATLTVTSGSASGSDVRQYVATGATYDTGMVTYRVPAADLSGGTGSTPGAPFSIGMIAQNVRPGTCMYYVGNIRLYWE